VIWPSNGPEGQDEKITAELLQLLQKEPKTGMQLKINDLLPPERKNKVKYAAPCPHTPTPSQVMGVQSPH
jgi:hypothetical protein